MGVDMQMFVRVKTPLTRKAVKKLSYSICEKFGSDKFWVRRPDEKSTALFLRKGQQALEIVKKITQDGPTINPKEGEQFIEVNIATRFYGEGYERGDILLAIGVAEFLEFHIVNASVWMGGDSSGICAEPFGREARESLKHGFFIVGHEPYRDHSFMDRGESSAMTKRHCEFCDHAMNRYGFGSGYSAFICYGCGLKEQTRDGGTTWQDVSREDL